MPYKTLSFELDAAALRPTFIAIIEQEGNEGNPFRVVVENAGSKEEALDDVKRWIAAREDEDAGREVSIENERARERASDILRELNETL